MEKGFRMLFYCKYLVKWYDYTVINLFRKTVQKYPNKAMLVNCASGKEWTYTEVMLLISLLDIYPKKHKIVDYDNNAKFTSIKFSYE